MDTALNYYQRFYPFQVPGLNKGLSPRLNNGKCITVFPGTKMFYINELKKCIPS